MRLRSAFVLTCLALSSAATVCGCITPLPAADPPEPVVVTEADLASFTVSVAAAPSITGKDAQEVIREGHWDTALPDALNAALQASGFRVVPSSQTADVVATLRATGVETADVGTNTRAAKFSVTLTNAENQQLVGSAEWTYQRPGISYNDMPERAAADLVALILRLPKVAEFAQSRRTAVAEAETPSESKPATESTPAAPPQGDSAPDFLSGAAQPTAFALIVGIEKYRDAPEATGAALDAKRFKKLARKTLGIRAENIRVALDERASKADIQKQVDWLAANVSAGGRVYFFYSGHGAPDASAGTSYLFPYDGDASALDRTALPLADVLADLGKSKAREVVAVVDSCFSGAGGRSVLPKGTRPLVRVKDTQVTGNITLLSAATGAEISGQATDGGGLFSKWITEGLGTGKADIDGDGEITVKELSEWVGPRVAREAKRDNREQHPSTTTGADASAVVFASGIR